MFLCVVFERELGVVQSGEASKGTQVHLVYVNQDKQVVGYLLAQPICEVSLIHDSYTVDRPHKGSPHFVSSFPT